MSDALPAYLSPLWDGTPATARAIATAEAQSRIDGDANQRLVDRLFPPLEPDELEQGNG